MSDNVKGMRDLLTYCFQMGHRKIAYIHGDESSVTSSRMLSFYKTAEELGLETPDVYMPSAPYRNVEAVQEQTRKLLELPDPPTCILCPDDFSAYGSFNAIAEKGLRIPQDVSVAGFDGIRITRHLQPQLTTIRQDTKAIGKLAAERLIALIEHPRTTLIEQIVVEGQLYVGNSVGKIDK